MRKIIYWVHASVDGYIDGPNGEFDWPALGPELSRFSENLHERVDTFLYGRKVWDMMSGFWPNAESISDDPHDLAFAPIWRKTPKIVFSRTLASAEHDARVIRGDLATEVAALKRGSGGDLLLNGGSELAGDLSGLGLIDEYLVVVHPVVLGGGTPLFRTPRERLTLRLVDTRAFDSRTVLLHYAPAGGDENGGS